MRLVPAKVIPQKTEQVTLGFKGLNKRPVAENGELTAMNNVSGRYNPALTSRPSREVIATLTSGTALFFAGNGKMCWVDGTSFVYDGTTKGTVTAGAKSITEYSGIILIFPDKKYYNCNTSTFGSISNCPDITRVCVLRNRAFGVGGDMFYASKISDPLTWDYFPVPYEDASSFQTNTGEPGNFTGMKVSLNQVKATKAGHLYELYGDKPKNFKLDKVVDVGCIDGDSIVDIDGILYFLSNDGFRAYAGSVPVPISDKLDEKYVSCVAETDGRHYYASLYNGSEYNLYVYDTRTGQWYREDNLQVKSFARKDDTLYALAADNKVYKFNSGNEAVEWSFETENFSEYWMGRKANKAVKFMADFETGSSMKVYCSLDDGDYSLLKTISESGFTIQEIDIRPQRVNRFKLKFECQGKIKFFGFEREVTLGKAKGG
jgi:hypothetical protein